MPTPTIKTIDLVNSVCLRVGYPVTSSAVSNSDTTYQQMVACLNDAGVDMLQIHDWPRMIRSFTFSVVADFAGQKEKGFPLPDDFYSFANDTQWNNSTQWPLRGPATPVQWNQLLVRSFVSQFSIIWRNKEDQFFVMSPPTNAQDLSFEYASNAWVQDADNPTVFKTQTDKDGDTLLLPPYILKQFTRAKWTESKGFKADAAYRDFYLALRRRIGADEGATVMTLNKRRYYEGAL